MPPPQKNSGARGSQRETKTTHKNNSFFEAYMSDLRKTGIVNDVHISRVLRNLGNGRVEVFYIDDKKKACLEKAYIRGLFRGKGKHSVNIDVNSIVLVADSGISGAAQYEIMALLSPEHVRELRKVVEPDPRILNLDCTDSAALVKNEATESGGFEFTEEEIDNL